MRVAFLFWCFLWSLTVSAQTFQWGRRGGGLSAIPQDREQVYKIATAPDGTVYTLSAVAPGNLNIEGNVKTFLGDNSTKYDVALASFACDGTYRWSRIIGGGSYEMINGLEVDSAGNVYISGKFGACSDSFPPKIDNIFTFSQFPVLDCSLIFIAKFTSQGNLEWLRRPQSSSVSISDGVTYTGGLGMALSNDGYLHWLVYLPPGTYANGAFVQNHNGPRYFIFRYDLQGNFVDALYLDMNVNIFQKFYRNPNNGKYYFLGSRFSNQDTVIVGGQTVTHSGYIFCLDSQGNLEWLRESSSTNNPTGTIHWYGLDFDAQDNIYFAGNMLGGGLESFMGITTPTNQNNAGILVVKLNTQGNVVWGNASQKDGIMSGDVAVNGNDLFVLTVCHGPTYLWQNQSIVGPGTNQGTDVVLGKFNATSGVCTQLIRIVGDSGFDDSGASLHFDSSGDLLVGGGFGHLLNTGNQLETNSAQSDFFIAKYGLSPCSLSTNSFMTEALTVSPNPAQTHFTLSGGQAMHYTLYTLTGGWVSEGELTADSRTVSVVGLAPGVYLLALETEGLQQTVKVVVAP